MAKAHKPTPRIAVAALSVAMGNAALAVGELQILPAGEFRSWDGRPEKAPAWRIDAAIAGRVIAELRSRINPIVIDYEHQTLLAEKNGQPAPAAGWIDPADVEWREGVGLVARRVRWTPRAAQMVDADEYRYFSPVFEHAELSGDVVALRMGALTNNPGLDGMAAVALTRLFSDSPHPQETPVNETLTKLLATLGLAADANEETALTAVAALKAKAGTADALTTEVAALKAKTPTAPDPAKYVPVEAMHALQTEVAALTAGITADKVGKAVEQALAAGKLLPAQTNWATELGKKDLAALTAYIDSAPQVAALRGTQTGGAAPEGGAGGSQTDAELAVCKALGLSADEFSKAKVG
ncbi:phage protease [Denitromonas halophila]|uniref:Protease (I) and scaffold (Z) protein n=1 Tax=Denitromonas halophila TaxID=1629404 RepID=A0A557QXH1_9RHOO|nr:phage protease [Denitromonas halophila]TVO57536.1 hypothetical protein FHP91_07620 [Denitromonas halophila]